MTEDIEDKTISDSDVVSAAVEMGCERAAVMVILMVDGTCIVGSSWFGSRTCLIM